MNTLKSLTETVISNLVTFERSTTTHRITRSILCCMCFI